MPPASIAGIATMGLAVAMVTFTAILAARVVGPTRAGREAKMSDPGRAEHLRSHTYSSQLPVALLDRTEHL
jgi:hypothetical protein